MTNTAKVDLGAALERCSGSLDLLRQVSLSLLVPSIPPPHFCRVGGLSLSLSTLSFPCFSLSPPHFLISWVSILLALEGRITSA